MNVGIFFKVTGDRFLIDAIPVESDETYGDPQWVIAPIMTSIRDYVRPCPMNTGSSHNYDYYPRGPIRQ